MEQNRSQGNNNGRLAIFFATVAVIIFGGYSLFNQTNNTAQVNVSSDNQQEFSSNEISYKGVEGISALNLLKQLHQVETKKFDFGEMVQSINGISADSKHFWSFYVNNAISTVGAGEYTTKTSDVIVWKLEEIK